MTAKPNEPIIIGGRYELTDAIKSGGQGQVWRAYDKTLDRPVAVKFLRPDLLQTFADRGALIGRFKREARVTARLDHPGVPAVHDASIDADADQLYIVMQLVTGTDLRDLLKSHGRLPVPWVVSIAAQVAAVLAHAHALPVIHRDLKPGNIMVGADGVVKVLDFGIAAILTADATRFTGLETPGTWSYMSPEQILGARTSPLSDLYSLGCVLYELLTGKAFARGGNPLTVMRRHVSAVPTPIGEVVTDVPGELASLVTDLLAKRPEDRPPSAQAVHARLVPLLPTPTTAPETENEATGDPTRPYRRPFALRKAPEPVPGAVSVLPPPPTMAAAVEELEEVQEHAYQLFAEERHAQAAALLAEAIESARGVLPSGNPVFLDARQMHARILVLGRDARGALPKFLALAEDYADVGDHDIAHAMRRAAADCHAVLGQLGEAIELYRGLVAEVGEHSDAGVELRHSLVRLLASSRDPGAGRAARELHAEFVAAFGPDDPRVRELVDLIARLP